MTKTRQPRTRWRTRRSPLNVPPLVCLVCLVIGYWLMLTFGFVALFGNLWEGTRWPGPPWLSSMDRLSSRNYSVVMEFLGEARQDAVCGQLGAPILAQMLPPLNCLAALEAIHVPGEGWPRTLSGSLSRSCQAHLDGLSRILQEMTKTKHDRALGTTPTAHMFDTQVRRFEMSIEAHCAYVNSRMAVSKRRLRTPRFVCVSSG